MSVVSRWWRAFGHWPRPARWVSYAAVALVLVLVATSLAAVWLIRRPLPQTTGTLVLPGLTAPVTVVRDSHGIPQIYADTTGDLMRAEGYVHAQDRFFEMDVRRHITSGRLSEMFGSVTLDIDKTVRTMGWRRVAEQELALVSPDTRNDLQAYADGVNAYLTTHTPSRISVEYTLLRASGLAYTPEPWTAVDSLSWLEAMAWDLRGNMDDEIARVLLAVNHTAAEVDQLYPPYPYATHAPIVGSGAVVDGVFDQNASGGTRNPKRPAWTPGAVAALRSAAAALTAVPTVLGGPSQSGDSASRDGLGSNSWVVSGADTTTGKPILANDPHLGVSMPGIWTQIGLHCRVLSPECPYDVAGFSFSGLPGVVIGHNDHIAWGFTNLDPDVSDLFLEKVRGDRYLYDGRWLPLVTRQETIRVRGAPDVHLTVRSTRHGPLLSDVDSELASVGADAQVRDHTGLDPGAGYAVSLEWTALTPSRTADALFAIDRARDWTEFRAGARLFAAPAQNLVYADTSGHIGYQAPGRVPIRKSGNDGLTPAAGWLPQDDWTGHYVPYDALPSEVDPAQGFIATANQAVIGRRYPYYLTDDWDYGYRSQRIRDRLEELTAGGGKVSVADMASFQLDDDNAMARVLVPYLLAVHLPPGFDSDGQRLLRSWDGRMDADSGAAAYFAVVWRTLLALTFHDEVRRSLWPDGDSRWFAVMTDLLHDPTSSWWDDKGTDGVVETRDQIIREALLDARVELTKRESLDPSRWTWGRLHQLDLRSSTLGESGVGVVERLLNRGGWQVRGSSSVIDASGWDAAVGYGVVSAPSMRMIVSLGDLDDSRWINLTGASGHPMSGHYTDQTELYVAGRTLPWRFTAAAVTGQDDTRTLTLEPGD